MFRVIVLATVSVPFQGLKETSQSRILLAFQPPGQNLRPQVRQHRHFKVTYSAYFRSACTMFGTVSSLFTHVAAQVLRSVVRSIEQRTSLNRSHSPDTNGARSSAPWCTSWCFRYSGQEPVLRRAAPNQHQSGTPK